MSKLHRQKGVYSEIPRQTEIDREIETEKHISRGIAFHIITDDA